MTFLKRLDAIATGVIKIAAGGAILVFVSGWFWESFDQAQRQQEVIGTVVAQESTKVCQRKAGRFNPWSCDRRITEPCPIVQYQPKTGKPLKLKDCSLKLKTGESVFVMYDSKAPSDARTYLMEGTQYHWFPVLIGGVPMMVAGLLLLTGAISLQAGIRNRPDSD
ncbi:MAG: DUF3592 domain-containing protein [Oscillatoriales cyanobacterium C42_A2020_001]|nr:DUF3592 domain-containing protein [Leptolyngbyaceae cyanobacterium C42_A2020_001]